VNPGFACISRKTNKAKSLEIDLATNKTNKAKSLEIDPAKKWGDTEIAERGRSVLVMRARYRSAGLTLHQRGWMDAG